MAKVTLEECNGNFEQMVKKFKKKVTNENIIGEYRKKEFYVAPSMKRKLKHEEAMKRARQLENKRARYYNPEY